MSIARIVARSAAVNALKGRTLVDDNVLDSEIGSIDIGADGSSHTPKDKAFIAVYTDDSEAEIDGADVRSLVHNGVVDLVFEFGITSTMTRTADDGSGQIVELEIRATDANFQFTLDIIARQISDALNDPSNEWAEIFRGLSFRYQKVSRVMAMNDENGVRLAAQQIRIMAELVEDPEIGCPLVAGTPFANYFAKADADPDLETQQKSAFLKTLFAGEVSDWESVRRRLGLTADEVLALGLGPIENDVDAETPEITAVSIEIDGLPAVDVTDA